MAVAGEPATRTLTFDERVKFQSAIERVHYAHQIDATKPFDEVITRTVLENKVLKYLEETAALAVYWKTPVTDEMLERELQRMAHGTRMPERLYELYTALDNDPFLFKECLARATLVDRLAHNFYAFDQALHAGERDQAESLRRQLTSGQLNTLADHANRSVAEFVVSTTELGPARPEVPFRRSVTPDEYLALRASLPGKVGEIGDVNETRDAFAFSVILSEKKSGLSVATYVVPKITWDAWWADARPSIRDASVGAVASSTGRLPAPRATARFDPTTSCAADSWDRGILGGAPVGRAYHSAVWTGSVMVIWGGENPLYIPPYGSYNRNDGGRYDPATDSWTSTSVIGAPQGRTAHVAVWTGSRMLIWGGQRPAGPYGARLLNDGGRYDPATDSWAPMSVTNAPAGRTGYTATWAGSVMVIWGGRVGTVLNTGGRYDPEADVWSPTSTSGAPGPRERHTAVWTGSRLIVWGGGVNVFSHYQTGLFNTGGSYDPTNDTWTPTTATGAPANRSDHTAVWTGSEMIVWGGIGLVGFDTQGKPGFGSLNTGARYDPAADAWVAISTAGSPAPREGYSAVWTGSRLVVWGNLYGAIGGGRYDPATDHWTSMTTTGAPAGRRSHNVVWTGSVMVVWGGNNSSGFPLDTGGRYDPEANRWTPTSVLDGPSGRVRETALWTGSLMLVWGGEDGTGSYHAVKTGARYDPATDSWAEISTQHAPTARSRHTAIWTGDRMVIWGGYFYDPDNYRTDYLNSGALYEPASDRWAPTPLVNGPSGRYRHSAVWTGTFMVVWGGLTETGYDASGGVFDPASNTWWLTSTDGAPIARGGHAAVWTGTEMIVWGGGASGYAEQGGRYDPENDAWRSMAVANSPTGRTDHNTFWTGRLMLVWGGTDASGVTRSGGRYDPTADTWTPISAVRSPTARTSEASAWSGNLMLIWGGGTRFTTDFGARYEPATDTWTPMSSSGAPLLRVFHAAVWTGSSMLVWGGYNDLGLLRDGGVYSPGELVDDDCDGDGFTAAVGDCDDRDPAVFPGAPSLCDGKNNDCADPAWPTVPDSDVNGDCDGDGFNRSAGDCRDFDPTSYPGAPQLCDGINNDCGALPANERDQDGDGFRPCQGDRSDSNPSIFPGAPQLCDGVNNDAADPSWPTVPANEADADGDGSRVCGGDCNDANPRIGYGLWEYCDGLDNDCNGLADDGVVSANCDDANSCTDDVCGGATGCAHVNNVRLCDDHDLCTTGDVCADGSCHGTPDSGIPCNDGDECTTGDTCADGICLGGPPLDCSDGLACNGLEMCFTGYGCANGQPQMNCNDYNPCTDDSCDDVVGCIHTNNAATCYDYNECTVDDRCSDGTCHGSPLDGTTCYDSNPCTTDETCTVGLCVGQPVVCDDGDPCNGVETCNPFESESNCHAGEPLNCDDTNTCTDDACDSVWGCVYTYTNAICDDGNRCTTADRCSIGICNGGPPVVCDDSNPCTTDSCHGNVGCVFTPNSAPCSDGNACTSGDICGATVCHPGTTISCNDDNPCTSDACDPSIGCAFTPNSAPCSDGNLCTSDDACNGGSCRGTSVACDDHNPCTDDTCNPSSGCVFPANTAACDDGNACTRTDRCALGACAGTDPVSCEALDQCHAAGACDPASGSCSNPVRPDGTQCDDGSLCTTGESCQSGACQAAASGLNHPTPKNSGYYRKLCDARAHDHLPYQGDRLTDADAACVGTLTATFAGISTIDEICDVIYLRPHGGGHAGGSGDGPGGKECDKGENELIATALNFCRARVCQDQSIDSRCHGVTHATAGQSFADADVILDDAARDKDTCKRATCELREINNGHALEMNSLGLLVETGRVRLNWSPPVLDDGSGMPSAYEIWRRPLGSREAFVKISTATGLTYLDTITGPGSWEYDVTAVIPGG